MKIALLFVSALMALSCQNKSLEREMNTAEVKLIVGLPDSIKQGMGIPDIYTHKIIEMETWYYGNDTIINFANQKIQNIKIK